MFTVNPITSKFYFTTLMFNSRFSVILVIVNSRTVIITYFRIGQRLSLFEQCRQYFDCLYQNSLNLCLSMVFAGCADFVPGCTDVGSQFGAASFETFGDVVRKASIWLSDQQTVRVTNIQSIDYKLQHGWGR